MAERQYIIRDDSVHETNHKNEEIIEAKKNKKDITYKGVDNEGNKIFIVDYNKKRIRPLVIRELEKMHYDGSGKKQKIIMIILLITSVFFGSQYFSLKSENERLLSQLNEKNNSFTEKIIPEVKEEEKEITINNSEKIENKDYELLENQNTELIRDIEDIKKDNEYEIQMISLRMGSEIKKLEIENSLLNEQISNNKLNKSDYELYKEIEAKFNEEKKKEITIISEDYWLKKHKDTLKKYADEVCKNYYNNIKSNDI